MENRIVTGVRKEEAVVATKAPVAGQHLPIHYDDGAGWPPLSSRKERAFRRGFLEEARRVAREWVDPANDAFDPFGEEEAAHKLRLRVRERYSVYGKGDAGWKTHHLGYRPGHEVPAARLRGRHHALAFVTQAWEHVSDFDTFDALVMPAWLAAVERWAEEPFRVHVISPPPGPLEIEAAKIVLRPGAKTEPARGDPLGKLPNCWPAWAAQTSGLRVDAVCLADVEPERPCTERCPAAGAEDLSGRSLKLR